MDSKIEVIAVLLNDGDADWPADGFDLESTTCLIRNREGDFRLQRADSQEALERTAETTGVFKQGEPIVDPASGDVIGYELEEIHRVNLVAG